MLAIHPSDSNRKLTMIYFDPKGTQDKLYAALAPIVEQYNEALDEEKADFKADLPIMCACMLSFHKSSLS